MDGRNAADHRTPCPSEAAQAWANAALSLGGWVAPRQQQDQMRVMWPNAWLQATGGGRDED